MNTNKWFLISIIIISLILFTIFPLNIQMTANSYWIYRLLSFIIFFLAWIFPIAYIYKNNNISNKYLVSFILIILNIIIIWFFLYFTEKESKYNEIKIKNKLKQIEYYNNLNSY